MVMAAVCQPLAARPRNIDHWPRFHRGGRAGVELGGEGLDTRGVDAPRSAPPEFLTYGEIFQIGARASDYNATALLH